MTDKYAHIVNFKKLVPITVDVEFDRLDTSLYEVLHYYKFREIISKREPNTPSGIACYWLYFLVASSFGEKEKLFGYIKLTRNIDVTIAEIQYTGGKRYKKLFDELLDFWKQTYEDYVTIAERVKPHKNVSKSDQSIEKGNRQKDYRTDTKKRVALALFLQEKDHCNRSEAARRSHTTTSSMKDYENLSEVKQLIIDFRANPDGAKQYQQKLPPRKKRDS